MEERKTPFTISKAAAELSSLGSRGRGPPSPERRRSSFKKPSIRLQLYHSPHKSRTTRSTKSQEARKGESRSEARDESRSEVETKNTSVDEQREEREEVPSPSTTRAASPTFSVNTEVAGTMNMSETEINKFVRESIERARNKRKATGRKKPVYREMMISPSSSLRSPPSQLLLDREMPTFFEKESEIKLTVFSSPRKSANSATATPVGDVRRKFSWSSVEELEDSSSDDEESIIHTPPPPNVVNVVKDKASRLVKAMSPPWLANLETGKVKRDETTGSILPPSPKKSSGRQEKGQGTESEAVSETENASSSEKDDAQPLPKKFTFPESPVKIDKNDEKTDSTAQKEKDSDDEASSSPEESLEQGITLQNEDDVQEENKMVREGDAVKEPVADELGSTMESPEENAPATEEEQLAEKEPSEHELALQTELPLSPKTEFKRFSDLPEKLTDEPVQPAPVSPTHSNASLNGLLSRHAAQVQHKALKAKLLARKVLSEASFSPTTASVTSETLPPEGSAQDPILVLEDSNENDDHKEVQETFVSPNENEFDVEQHNLPGTLDSAARERISLPSGYEFFSDSGSLCSGESAGEGNDSRAELVQATSTETLETLSAAEKLSKPSDGSIVADDRIETSSTVENSTTSVSGGLGEHMHADEDEGNESINASEAADEAYTILPDISPSKDDSTEMASDIPPKPDPESADKLLPDPPMTFDVHPDQTLSKFSSAEEQEEETEENVHVTKGPNRAFLTPKAAPSSDEEGFSGLSKEPLSPKHNTLLEKYQASDSQKTKQPSSPHNLAIANQAIIFGESRHRKRSTSRRSKRSSRSSRRTKDKLKRLYDQEMFNESAVVTEAFLDEIASKKGNKITAEELKQMIKAANQEATPKFKNASQNYSSSEEEETIVSSDTKKTRSTKTYFESQLCTDFLELFSLLGDHDCTIDNDDDTLTWEDTQITWDDSIVNGGVTTDNNETDGGTTTTPFVPRATFSFSEGQYTITDGESVTDSGDEAWLWPL